MRPFTTMVYRQLKRFVRARSRLIGSIANSVVWLVFFGVGFSGFVKNYLSFLAPGIFIMAVFNYSVFSGMSVIWDKEFGFLKEVLVAPSSRKEVIAGRIFGDSLVSIAQGLLILILSFGLVRMNPLGIPPATFFGFAVALCFSSMGVVIALKMKSMEGFHAIMSVLILPTIFLSGALFPIKYMPAWMRVIAYLNPMTYAVDGARFFLTGIGEIGATFDFLAISIVSVVSILLATISFERTGLE